MPSALVIGADGLIGGELLRQLRERRWVTVGTTRHADGDAARARFDLADPPAGFLSAPPVRKLGSEGSWVAFLVAAISGYARCAQDPVATRRINVANSITLVVELVESGAFVVYPSSSAVFGDAAGRCDESSLPSATSEYGRQKADAERGMLSLITRVPGRGGVAVVRLTKVIATRGLVGQWMQALKGGGIVEAATDLRLSPISLSFAVRGLIEIAARSRSGVYHLSGEGVMSYFEFALWLADALGVERAKVRPVEVGSAKAAGAASGVALDMSETTKYAPLSPQTVDSVILDVVSSR